jgi:hypothetical protein
MKFPSKKQSHWKYFGIMNLQNVRRAGLEDIVAGQRGITTRALGALVQAGVDGK